jgi:RNA polymerase sigma-70 factor (ECF subfamily)
MDARLTIGDIAVTLDGEALYVVAADDFEQFYRRTYPGLVAVARAMAGGMNAPDDLVQDAMLRAFVHWPRVRDLEYPAGWCHRVLLNLCAKWYWRRRTEARWLAQQRWGEPSSPGPTATAVAFCDAARKLPSRPRAAVLLHYLADRPVAEVAAILKVPEGTVRSDLSRARAVLAIELGIDR